MTNLTDDPILALERELVAAAARQASPSPAADPAGSDPAQRGDAQPGSRTAVHRLRRHLGIPATIAAVLIPVIVVAAALALTRTASPGQRTARPLVGHAPTPGSTQAATPPRQRGLSSVLAVLRRPRTPADTLPRSVRLPAGPDRAAAAAGIGVPQLHAGRLATITPWGAKVFLVPYVPISPAAVAHLGATAKAQWRRRVRLGETLGILTTQGGSLGTSLADVLAGRALDISIVGTTPGAPATLQVIQVVPDGVAWVRFDLKAPHAYGGPRHPMVQVSHNVAALQLPDATGVSVSATHWFTADHRPRQLPTLRATRPFLRHVAAVPTPPSGDDLPALLAVLRRPQTAADRSLPALHRPHGFDPALGTPDRPLARLATTTPWGGRIYLIPFTTPTGPGQILDVFGMGGTHTLSGAAGFSAAQITTGQAFLSQRVSGTHGGLRVLVVVPDAVRTIRVALPGVGAATGESHGNVVALVLPGAVAHGAATITWFGARGRALGSFPWAIGTA